MTKAKVLEISRQFQEPKQLVNKQMDKLKFIYLKEHPHRRYKFTSKKLNNKKSRLLTKALKK